MRYFLFLICCGIFACSSKNSSNPVSDKEITVSIDTVYLDGKGEIIFVFNGLSVSDFSADQRLMFNFDFMTPSIEIFDLDNLEFRERILLEKEGPNGVGEMVYDFNLLEGDLFFAGSRDQNLGLFSFRGEMQRNITLDKIHEIKQVPFGTLVLNQSLVLQSEPLILFGEFSDWSKSDGTGKEFIGVWYEDEEYFEEYAIEDWFGFENYRAMVNLGNFKTSLNAYWFLMENIPGGVVVSTNLTSSFLWFDKTKREFRLVNENHQLIPNTVNAELSDSYPSSESFSNALNEIKKEISYLKPVWDWDNEVFYRFAYKEKFDANGKVVASHVYLSVLNKDFSLIQESHIPQLNKSPNFHFVKDGKIWIFENIEDEVSFIRLKVDL